MAVYTHISDSELEAFLARFDLGAPRAFKGIAEGVENSNFLLDTERGRFFLTLYERRVKREDLPFFLGLMEHLAKRGFPSPTPVADRDGVVLQTLGGRPAAIVTFMPGVSASRPTAAHCFEAGQGLARLHAAGRDFPLLRMNDLGHQRWRALFAPLRDAAEALETGLLAMIEADLARLEALWPTNLPFGVVHADLFPDNVFFIDGRFAAAFDFYFACNDALVYDLGVCLNAWCFEEDGALSPDRAKALISGYAAVRPLEAQEVAALPVVAYGAALRFFLTRLADWGRDDAGALVRPKDPREYARKLEHHRRAVDRSDPYGLTGAAQ